MRPLHALLVTAAALLPCDERRDAGHGFRIDVPAGWTTQTEDSPGGRHTLRLLPPGSAGEVHVGVSVWRQPPGTGMEMVRAAALAWLADSGLPHGEPEWREAELAGRSATTLDVRLQTGGVELRIEVRYLIAGERGYGVQRVAPVAEFDARAAELAAVLDSFAPLEPTADEREAAAAREALLALATRCGGDLDWAESWEQAATRARTEGRPVLVVAYLYPGFELGAVPRFSVFANADIAELVRARFVPYWLRLDEDSALARSYGLSPSSFGRALLLASPDGRVWAECEHADDEDLAYAFLRGALLAGDPQAGAAAPDDTGASANSGPTADADADADANAAASARDEEAAIARELTGLGPVARARVLIGRGELEAALAALEGARTVEALRLRARALRLLRRGEDALAALDAARRKGGGSDPSLHVEEGSLLLRLGRTAEGRAALERALDAADDHARSATAAAVAADAAAEAHLLLGLADLAEGDRSSAERRWRELAASHPDERAAWQASAWLTSGLLDLVDTLDLGWPTDAEVAALLEPPHYAPLPAARRAEAEAGALAWLLAAQRADGSWPCPSERHTRDTPDPFVEAVAGIGLSALLPQREGPRAAEADAAARRALQFVVARAHARAADPPGALAMDYWPWSDAFMLGALAEAAACGLATPAELEAPAQALVADLARRAQSDGGWGYYLGSGSETGRAPPISMSFTTAAAVLALRRAGELGAPPPAGLLESAVAALAGMRGEDGWYAYWAVAGQADHEGAADRYGASGRGPACDLALLHAGAGSRADLRGALDRFLEGSALLDAERGKVLMHSGPDGQGCHYLLFDHLHAALAFAELARGEGALADAALGERLAELLLNYRQADGSFLDTPILGSGYGTAAALRALHALTQEDASALAPQARVLEGQAHHLGDTTTDDWPEASAVPEGLAWSLEFEGRDTGTEQTLLLTQRGVNTSWVLRVNGTDALELRRGEDRREVPYRLAAGLVRDGKNRLDLVSLAEGDGNRDDITVGPVRLDERPLVQVCDLRPVRLSVEDAGSGALLPARVTLTDADGVPVPRELLQLEGDAASLPLRDGLLYAGELPVLLYAPAHALDAWAVRGPEWSLARARIPAADAPAADVPAAAEPVEVRLVLRRELDTTGYVAADTHVHTLTFSGHGDASLDERVLTLAGEGVELAIATDHNHVTDYRPRQAALGLQRHYTAVPGDEVTTERGHFNAFPLDPARPPPEHRGEDWVALVQGMRDAGAQVVILNHPRWPDEGRSPFTLFGLDHATGAFAQGQPLTMDAMELTNATDNQPDPLLLVRDWFALLNRGERLAAVGSSDSHTVGDPVGQGRTWVPSATDDPAAIDVEAACRAIAAGRTSVGQGIFVTLAVDGRDAMGALVPVHEGRVRVALRVRAPAWVRPRTARLYVHGLEVAAAEVPSSGGPSADGSWDAAQPTDVELPFDVALPGRHDGWLVAVVTGDAVAGPFWPALNRYTLGATNPVFLDADGDGDCDRPRDIAAARLEYWRSVGPAGAVGALRSVDAAVLVHMLDQLRPEEVGIRREIVRVGLAAPDADTRAAVQAWLDAH